MPAWLRASGWPPIAAAPSRSIIPRPVPCSETSPICGRPKRGARSSSPARHYRRGAQRPPGHMAAPTNAANVKKVLANPESSTQDPKRKSHLLTNGLSFRILRSRNGGCATPIMALLSHIPSCVYRKLKPGRNDGGPADQPTSPLAIRVGRMQTVRRKNADRGNNDCSSPR